MINFGLAITATKGVNTNTIQKLSESLESYFSNKDYGIGVKSFTIGVICVSSEFDQFFKKKKIKYTKGKETINPDGFPFILEDSLEYDIKLDYKLFTQANDKMVLKILATEIISSFEVFEKKKIKDFDSSALLKDLKVFFEKRGL